MFKHTVLKTPLPPNCQEKWAFQGPFFFFPTVFPTQMQDQLLQLSVLQVKGWVLK
jgi:hypothetical protein